VISLRASGTYPRIDPLPRVERRRVALRVLAKRQVPVDERSLLDDLRDAREAAIAAGDEPVDVKAMLAALDDDCEHCAEAAELAESEDR